MHLLYSIFPILPLLAVADFKPHVHCFDAFGNVIPNCFPSPQAEQEALAFRARQAPYEPGRELKGDIDQYGENVHRDWDDFEREVEAEVEDLKRDISKNTEDLRNEVEENVEQTSQKLKAKKKKVERAAKQVGRGVAHETKRGIKKVVRAPGSIAHKIHKGTATLGRKVHRKTADAGRWIHKRLHEVDAKDILLLGAVAALSASTFKHRYRPEHEMRHLSTYVQNKEIDTSEFILLRYLQSLHGKRIMSVDLKCDEVDNTVTVHVDDTFADSERIKEDMWKWLLENSVIEIKRVPKDST